jgi:hypothetical protein
MCIRIFLFIKKIINLIKQNIMGWSINTTAGDVKAAVASNSDSSSRNGSVTVDKEGSGSSTFLMNCAIELRDGQQPGQEWWEDELTVDYFVIYGKKQGDTEARRYKIPANVTGLRNSYQSESVEFDNEWKGMRVIWIKLIVDGDTSAPEDGRTTSIVEWNPDSGNVYYLDEGNYFRLFCIRDF